jgi:hypothetical protein
MERRASKRYNTPAMTMTHRAFALDHAAFSAELRPLLLRALETNDCAELARFIDQNLAALSDPYEGEPLAADWRNLLEENDAHEHGDFALTKYYDSELDVGLDADWEEIGELLEKSGSSGNLMLGAPLGPEAAPFDPGRQGAYFQSEVEVAQNERELLALLAREPALTEPLGALRGMLSQAARHGKGLYVTF